MKMLIAALAAATLVSGCVKMDKTPPKDLPAYVRIYPGGQQVMAMNLGAMSSEVFQAAAKPDDIIAYYRTQAASDGLAESATPAQSGAPADQRQAAFGDPGTDKMLVVVARPQGDGSMVSLTYKPAPKTSS